MDVQLYVYDLSQGLARQMSMQFLGTQIDAVYHTSLVFGDVEYFFGRGIHTAHPGSTHHGRPMEVIPLGQTSLPHDVIEDYLESLKDIYTAESYSLFYHNCNNFTNDFAMFLVGRGIPGHITSLPKTVLDTPFGQMLQTQLDGAMRPITQAPVAASSPARNGITARAKANGNDAVLVQNITSLPQLEHALSKASSSCAAVFFTSATCGPCKALYPLFDDLAAENGSQMKFLKVDVSVARDVGMSYAVSATPTFVTFLKGKQYDRWTGADASQLRGNVRVVLHTAFPPHPHHSLKTPYLRRLGATKAVTYSKIPPLDKLKAKMGEQGKAKEIETSMSFISSRSSSSTSQSVPVPNLPNISSFLLDCLQKVPAENLFAVYDLFRLLLLDPRVSGYFLAENSLKTIQCFLDHITKLKQGGPSALPYNLHLCAIHLASNLFTSNIIRDAIKSTPTSEHVTSSLINLITSAILNQERPALQVSASSLAYNLSKLESTERLKALEQNNAAPSLFLPEGAQIELAASLIEAISNAQLSSSQKAEAATKTTEEHAAFRYQTLALAHLIYLAPLDSELFDLCKTLDVASTLAGKAAALEGVGSRNDAAAANKPGKESELQQTQSLMKEMIQLLRKEN